MPNEMIRRVAVAIRDSQRSSSNLDFFYPYAKAAIEAMREPTDEMVNVGENQFFDAGYMELRAAWRNMIDAALKE